MTSYVLRERRSTSELWLRVAGYL